MSFEGSIERLDKRRGIQELTQKWIAFVHQFVAAQRSRTKDTRNWILLERI
jgi:hypothetical protein